MDWKIQDGIVWVRRRASFETANPAECAQITAQIDTSARQFLGAACALLDWARKNADVPDDILADWNDAEKSIRRDLGPIGVRDR